VKDQKFPRYIAPHFPQYLFKRTLEAVNGVPIAVEDEVAPPVKGEPIVAVRVKLKWSSHSVTASHRILNVVSAVLQVAMNCC
jgi:hypothetical protein